jgi:hypothetical protein
MFRTRNVLKIAMEQLHVEVWQRAGTPSTTPKMSAVTRFHGLPEKIVFWLEARDILVSDFIQVPG